MEFNKVYELVMPGDVAATAHLHRLIYCRNPLHLNKLEPSTEGRLAEVCGLACGVL